jgi:hypothetical protein
MKTNSLLSTAGTLSLAALLATNVHAGTPSTNHEPARIFDMETGQFEPNPDYHERAPVVPARRRGPAPEPRRIFNTATRNFEPNPDYHEPAPVKRPAHRTKSVVEPARIYDLETGQFEPNPDYHEPAPVVPRRQGGQVTEPSGIFHAFTRGLGFRPQPRREASQYFDAETRNIGPNPLFVHPF